ncbi:MAG: D-glycero-beta-D-manno-heptose 1-phosphate adenylyltransferase [Candidatus Omnitrophota bacterium]
MNTCKIIKPEQLKGIISAHKKNGRKIAFTNGCFDLLHPGHVSYLTAAKKRCDILIVALNTDSSIRQIKGDLRPIMKLADRQKVVAALEAVDYVTSFPQKTPLKLISELKPDFVIKGGDWKAKDIIGADIVACYGGKAISVNYKNGYSSSDIIRKIVQRHR